LDEIELDFVEREATPRLLMKLSIQLHLAGLSLSNTVSFLDRSGVDRARSTVHNWVHKADLQPAAGKSPDCVAVDETVIQLDDQQYWLYAVVDPDCRNALQTAVEQIVNSMELNSDTTTQTEYAGL
jgi:transposase-like protein